MFPICNVEYPSLLGTSGYEHIFISIYYNHSLLGFIFGFSMYSSHNSFILPLSPGFIHNSVRSYVSLSQFSHTHFFLFLVLNLLLITGLPFYLTSSLLTNFICSLIISSFGSNFLFIISAPIFI